jgi:hypothetical protein
MGATGIIDIQRYDGGEMVRRLAFFRADPKLLDPLRLLLCRPDAVRRVL